MGDVSRTRRWRSAPGGLRATYSRAIDFFVESTLVEQHAANARAAGANDVDLVEIPDVDGRRRVGAGLLQCDLKQARIRFLHTFFERIQDVMKVPIDRQPAQDVAEPSVGVRDDDELQTPRAQRFKHGGNVRRHVLPEVLARVIVVQFRQRRGRRLGR